MRLLVVHNHYLLPGGEDQVYRNEIKLLRDHGNDVIDYSIENKQIASMSSISLALQTIWSKNSYYQIKKIIQSFRPELVHFHNPFPLISPSAYYACHSLNIPVVQTLHNYRLLCPSALFLRDSKPCEDCLNKFFYWPGVWHSCYRNSHIVTGMVATMLQLHRFLSTWKHRIDCYIALTEFARQKFIAGGLPANKITTKPNFLVSDPGAKQDEGSYALFLGRLSNEKGIDCLINAWSNGYDLPLKIAGDGPLREQLSESINKRDFRHISLEGFLSSSLAIELIKKSRFMIFPSLWYEGFPLVIVEAFACGVPVIASRLGAVTEIMKDGKTGLLFNPGDAQDLATKIIWALNHPEELMKMGQTARSEYLEKYTAERNYQQLMEIYQKTEENH